MVKGKEYVITKNFQGEPKPEDLSLVEFQVPPIKDGEVLVEAEYLSVDPYMRCYSMQLPVGSRMLGSQVAKIVESKDPNWPVGKRVVCNSGWVTHTVFNPNDEVGSAIKYKPFLLPDLGELPPSLALGVLGMPGYTAYFGFLEICKPKAGETVVITGAAGAVGSHVGQIARILGLKVIGIAGSEEKCKWIVDELGFDHAINYKTDDVATELKKVAPDGVNCYFDNVGGEISSIVINQMADFGRISVCGSISAYDSLFPPENMPKATIIQPAMIFHQLKMEGFLVLQWMNRWSEGFEKNLTWIHEGKLRYKETITEGFDNMYKAFRDMLKGGNVGKAIVKV